MIRKLAVALSLTSVLSASIVQALGLGEASVESTLNQPLKAEIELVNVRDLEDNEILPGLASREEFLKAGVERIYFLSDVRFEVIHKDGGKVVVKLTTNKPVREPFLNFLVEVIWPSGRLLREYALLIDPPIYSEEPLAPVQQVELSPATETASMQSRASESADVMTPAAVTNDVSSGAQGEEGGDTYGPTNNSDTMWAIALKVRPNSSVTAQQTMLAIQELNPDSFINNNINSLKTGRILRLPELNQIRQLSKRDAVRGVIAQNRRFENKVLSRNVVDAAPEEAMVQQAASLDVAPTAKSGDELKLVVAESRDVDQQSGAHAGESATDGSSSALKNDLAITLEKLDQSNREKTELNSRVTDLEEQLETLQRLLTLKDDQLANLQTQMGQDDAAPVKDELPLKGDTSSAVPAEVAAQTEMAQTVDADKPVAEIMQETAVTTPGVEPKVPETVKPDIAPVVDTPVEKSTAKPLSMQSVIDMVLNNPLYQAIAGGVVLLLLLVVWALSRRNAQKEQEFFETRNEDGEEPGDIFDVEAASGSSDTEDTTVDTDDVSLVPDEDVTAVQSETEDVIAEADIYIAYGRLDQASQLLENAISSEPQRVDIRIKLLDVYAESNELESFDKQFNEIEALNDDYALEQATQVKAKMKGADNAISIDDLENQLLSGESAESEGHSPIEYDMPEKDDELSEVSMDLSDDLLSMDEELSNLESELELDSAADVEDSLAEEDDLDIDFDINEIDLDEDVEVLDESSSLDFDLENDDLTVSLEEESEIELSVDGGLDVDLELEESVVDDSDLSVDDVLIEPDTELEGELEAVDLELDLESTELDGVDEEDLSLDEGGLSLDDLDLELDKIDSDLDVSFDVEATKSEELVELEGDLNLDVEDLSAELELDSNSALGELEDIADVLADDDSLDDVSVDDVELDSAELGASIDDSLLESAEPVLDEADNFESELANDEDFDFLAGTDEAATKLDLARAYIDMGDADGAKDILEEVSLEGNDEQKQDAQDLLKTLD